jgi:hypothetical protein
MLKGFAQILETFGMDDDCIENAGVAVSEINSITDDSMEIVLEDKDGNKRTFHLVEVVGF